MLKNVLFATDLSSYARAVVDCLLGLGQAGVREVVLLHVIDQSLSYVEGAAGFDVIGQLKLDAQRALAEERQRLESEGFQVHVRLEVGIPAAEIVRVAEEEDVSLIVVGAYGRTFLRDVLLGSVAERVLHLARRPVLVERPTVLSELGAAQCRLRGAQVFSRLLLPTDFSPAAALAERFVSGLREVGAQEVLVLHVLEEPAVRGRRPEEVTRLAGDAQARLTEVVAGLEAQGFAARGLLERGRPVERILEVAEREDVGSIVAGSRGRGIVAEVLLGSVAEGVARRSRRPVVVVPAR